MRLADEALQASAGRIGNVHMIGEKPMISARSPRGVSNAHRMLLDAALRDAIYAI